MNWTLNGRPLRRILVTRLRYMGDIAMSTVVLQLLKAGDPALDLGYLCEAAYAPLLAADPRLDRCHALAVDRRGADADARRSTSPQRIGLPPDSAGTLGLLRQLHRQHYDLAIDLYANPRSAWLLRLAGISLRIAGPAGSRSRLYTHLAPAPTAQDDPQLRALAGGVLAEHVSRLFPLVHQPDGLTFRDWFVQTRSGRPLLPDLVLPPDGAPPPTEAGAILLAPGATWPTKAWPLAHWRQLIEKLGGSAGERVLILSSPGTRNPAAELASGPLPANCRVLPVLPLAAALQVITASRAVVSVDGGVVHAAVALGRPTLALFGPTAPDLWFPYSGLGPYRVLCARPPCHPCDRHVCDDFICLPAIEPAAVHDALFDLLATRTAS